MENYEILHKIGSGSFAKVYTAIQKTTGKKIALKVIPKKEIKNERIRQRLMREIKIMQELKHDNIVDYIEHFETTKAYYICMELVSNGELYDYIAKSQQEGIPEDEAKFMFSQIASAVQYCHKNNVSHRDLKLENILLGKNNKPKLVDFGFSKMTHPNPMIATYCGSTLYASPEMIFGKPYRGPECDVWSLGIILYCMLTGHMPFDDRDWGSFATSIERADYQQPHNVSENARNLLSQMLHPSAYLRATIDDVMAHPWLSVSPHRKISLQLPPKSQRHRRMGVSHSKSDAYKISHAVVTELATTCQCQCHYNKHIEHSNISRNDSAMGLHCEDCEPIGMMKTMNSTNITTTKKNTTISVCSSGYSSSCESLNSPQEPSSGGSTTRDVIMFKYNCSECLEPLEDETVELVFA